MGSSVDDDASTPERTCSRGSSVASTTTTIDLSPTMTAAILVPTSPTSDAVALTTAEAAPARASISLTPSTSIETLSLEDMNRLMPKALRGTFDEPILARHSDQLKHLAKEAKARHALRQAAIEALKFAVANVENDNSEGSSADVPESNETTEERRTRKLREKRRRQRMCKRAANRVKARRLKAGENPESENDEKDDNVRNDDEDVDQPYAGQQEYQAGLDKINKILEECKLATIEVDGDATDGKEITPEMLAFEANAKAQLEYLTGLIHRAASGKPIRIPQGRAASPEKPLKANRLQEIIRQSRGEVNEDNGVSQGSISEGVLTPLSWTEANGSSDVSVEARDGGVNVETGRLVDSITEPRVEVVEGVAEASGEEEQRSSTQTRETDAIEAHASAPAVSSWADEVEDEWVLLAKLRATRQTKDPMASASLSWADDVEDEWVSLEQLRGKSQANKSTSEKSVRSEEVSSKEKTLESFGYKDWSILGALSIKKVEPQSSSGASEGETPATHPGEEMGNEVGEDEVIEKAEKLDRSGNIDEPHNINQSQKSDRSNKGDQYDKVYEPERVNEPEEGIKADDIEEPGNVKKVGEGDKPGEVEEVEKAKNAHGVEEEVEKRHLTASKPKHSYKPKRGRKRGKKGKKEGPPPETQQVGNTDQVEGEAAPASAQGVQDAKKEVMAKETDDVKTEEIATKQQKIAAVKVAIPKLSGLGRKKSTLEAIGKERVSAHAKRVGNEKTDETDKITETKKIITRNKPANARDATKLAEVKEVKASDEHKVMQQSMEAKEIKKPEQAKEKEQPVDSKNSKRPMDHTSQPQKNSTKSEHAVMAGGPTVSQDRRSYSHSAVSGANQVARQATGSESGWTLVKRKKPKETKRPQR